MPVVPEISVIVSQITPVLAHVMAILGNLSRPSTGLQIVPQLPSVVAEVSPVLSDITAIFSDVLPVLTEVPPVFPHLSSPYISDLCECGLLNCHKRER
jgi:hypothetical protein